MALKAVAAPLGSPVGGSGTANTIPRWTGASTLGDSGLIDNGTAIYTTTRKIAVGSASAVSEFTAVTGAVAPTANPPALQTLHGNDQNVFRAKYTSTNFNVSGNWLGLGLGYYDNYMKAAIIAEAKDGSGRANMHIALNAAATAANVGLSDARLTVTYDGNVGIAAASPTAALDTPASTTTRATLRIRSGVAPTAPNTGDVWFDGTSLFMRNGAGTQTVSFGGGGGATAWVNFNGTGVAAIRGDAGVSSVADGGVAIYTVNFDTAMPDANYAVTTSAWYEGVAAGAMGVTARATNSVTLKAVATQTGALTDMLECHCAIFR